MPAAAALFSAASLIGAAAISSAFSADKVQHLQELTAAAKEEAGPQQGVVLNLMESATSMIARTPEPVEDDQAVIQELAAGLADADDPVKLTALVSRYTSWQQEFFTRLLTRTEIPHVEPTVSTAAGADSISSQDAVHQVQESFAQLRQAMMDEFNLLRKELKKG